MNNIIDIIKICPTERSSREAGEVLRNSIIELFKNYNEVTILFHGKRIASTSFLDEALVKLIGETLTEKEFKDRIILKDITKGDQELLNSIIRSRKKIGAL